MNKIYFTFPFLLILIKVGSLSAQNKMFKNAPYDVQVMLNEAKQYHRNFQFVDESNSLRILGLKLRAEAFNTEQDNYLLRKQKQAIRNDNIQCYLENSYGVGFTYQYCGSWMGTNSNFMASLQFMKTTLNRKVGFMGEFYTNFSITSVTSKAENSVDFQYELQPEFQWDHVGFSGGVNLLAIFPLYVYAMTGLGYGSKSAKYNELENIGTPGSPNYSYRQTVWKSELESFIVNLEGGIIVSTPHIGFTLGYKHYFAPIDGLIIGGGPKVGLLINLPFKAWFGSSYLDCNTNTK